MLTCHLKRFQQDARGRLRKIQGGIPFARELDLAQYCDPKVRPPCPPSMKRWLFQRHLPVAPSYRQLPSTRS